MARAPALQEVEAVPQSDVLEGFPHPRATVDLFGHQKIERELAEVFSGGRMHHAWLIGGREGIGKATLAYRLARFVLATPDQRDPFGASLAIAPEHTAARQVLSASHPGLLVLRRPWEHKTKRFLSALPVDEVRRLKSFFGLTTGDGQWRVVIVDSADDLNISAANALLKSLEEPPARALFILITSAPGRLLPTIRSRCRTLDLAPLGGEDLRRAVIQAIAAGEGEAPSAGDWPRIETASGGSVRRALALAEANGIKTATRIDAILSSLPKVDWGTAHALADDIAGSAAEAKFDLAFDLLLDGVARLVRAAETGTGAPSDLQLARRLIGPGRGPAWAMAWQQAIDDRTEAMTLNLDRKSLVLLVIERFAAVARGAR